MSDFKQRLADVQDVSKVFDDPTYYGLPTFEEFSKNSEKYIGRDDDALSQVDAGSKQLDRHVQRHVYEIEGYRCKSLEEVERIATAQGIPLRELDYRPQVQPTGAGKCDILVRFVSRSQRDERAKW